MSACSLWMNHRNLTVVGVEQQLGSNSFWKEVQELHTYCLQPRINATYHLLWQRYLDIANCTAASLFISLGTPKWSHPIPVVAVALAATENNSASDPADRVKNIWPSGPVNMGITKFRILLILFQITDICIKKKSSNLQELIGDDGAKCPVT